MAEVIRFGAGGYRYLKAVFQYSSGVAAEPGFEIERVRLLEPLPLAAGFRFVEKHLERLGRPATAFAACELRSPEPFTEQGFIDFNREYVKTLARWGIYRDEINPVARTNVCPKYCAPKEPALYAFSYTVPAPQAARDSFIIAGGAEARDRIELRDKVRHVAGEMERRLAALGVSWRDAVSTQAYCVHDIGAFVGPELAARELAL